MFHNYKLVGNEDLNSVATRFQTTNEVLRNLNSWLNFDELKENSELVVPEKTYDYYNYYTVEKGDNIYGTQRFRSGPAA